MFKNAIDEDRKSGTFYYVCKMYNCKLEKCKKKKDKCKHKNKCTDECHGGCKQENNCWYDYEAEVIIIGVGTAGSQLLGLLSTKYKVLALEAGKDLRGDPATGNPANAFTILAYDATYSAVTLTRQIPAIGNQRVNYTAGIMLGGSGEHNQALAVNPSPQKADTWATAIDQRWASNNIFKVLATTETFTATADGPPRPINRGFSGPLQIRQGPSSAFSKALAQAAHDTIPSVSVQPDIAANTTYNSGINSCASIDSESFLDANGVRSSPDRVYLNNSVMVPLDSYLSEYIGVNGHNLRLMLDSPVNRIIFARYDGKVDVNFDQNTDPNAYIKPLQAIGVQFSKNGKTYIAKGGAIISCLGALGSPMLLNYSGIGDPEVLKPLRIPTLLSQPLIGKFLATQYGPTFIITTTQFSLQSGALLFLPYNNVARRFQVISFPAGPNRYNLLLWDLLPRSTGTIKPTNQSNFYRTDIDPKYYSNPQDISDIVGGMRLLYSILVNFRNTYDLGLKFVNPPENLLSAPPSPQSDAALFALVRPPNWTMADHYSGTVSMGNDPTIHSVDTQFKLRNTNNLYIVDASVIPVIKDNDAIYPLQNDGNTIRSINAYTQIAANQMLGIN